RRKVAGNFDEATKNTIIISVVYHKRVRKNQDRKYRMQHHCNKRHHHVPTRYPITQKLVVQIQPHEVSQSTFAKMQKRSNIQAPENKILQIPNHRDKRLLAYCINSCRAPLNRIE